MKHYNKRKCVVRHSIKIRLLTGKVEMDNQPMWFQLVVVLAMIGAWMAIIFLW